MPEIGWHYPNHYIVVTIELNRAPDYVFVRCKPVSPELVAKHNHVISTLGSFLR